MKLGIQYLEELQLHNAKEIGFSNFEVYYEDCESADLDQVAGVVLKVEGLNEEIFRDAINQAKKYGAEYLLLDTQGVEDETVLREVLCACIEDIKEVEIDIYIENGYKYQRNGDFCQSFFSDTYELKRLVQEFNELCGREHFGVGFNVGYAELVGKDVKLMMEELGTSLKLLHASENDGRTNQHQLPCTFAIGRGVAATNWYRLIGVLLRNKFDGWIVFDTIGGVKRTPEKLQKSMLKLLWDLGQEWNAQFCLDEKLNQPEKKLILFGAGKMAENYMESWGDKYPPAFLVDNYSKAWGMKILGFEVKSPNAILEIPENERNVWICNQYYDAVGKRLRDMGVEYQCFWDQYYL